jgi:Methyl-accepting chemotaxis protein-like, first PDC sensor domain
MNPTTGTAHRHLLAAVLLSILPLSVVADDGCTDSPTILETALVRAAAGRIDAILGAVADSTRALGDTYGRLAAAQGDEGSPDRERWLALRTTRGNTTGLRTWPSDLGSPPASQTPYPGFYSFNGGQLSDAVLRELDLFERLVPTLRSAYESFPFSWVYVTTADEAMMIYPYVPIEEAVNDGTPTKTLYYKAADFAGHAVGWTAPYLDLVGAGMMVTASYPIYRGARLLGVMSRDITLKQLTASVLPHLTGDGSSALLIDANGLAIDATDPTLAAEIDRVNTKAGAAVLHYRTAAGLEKVATKGAVASKAAGIDALVEQVLASIADGDTVRLDMDGQKVLSGRVARTGWLLVLMRWYPSLVVSSARASAR